MKLIDRYICREVFSHALVGLAIFTFVFFVPRLLQMMELVVRHSAAPARLALLFLCAFPPILKFTLPIAVLVGVLIGLGRMSADSELIALNSVGIGMRRVLVPVGALALSATALTLVMTLWLGPRSISYLRQTEDQLAASQASFQIQPRVFDERFPHLILYVQDATASATHWHGVFLAEIGSDKHSELTVAEDAIVVSSRGQSKSDASRIDLHLRDGSTHEFVPSNPNQYVVSTFSESDWPVELGGLEQTRTIVRSTAEKSLSELVATQGPGSREALVEAEQRFAFPGACIVFALLAVPLAARPRRGGRAMGFLMSLLLVCGYYLVLVLGSGFARQGKISPALGAWLADFVTLIAGIILLPRMEQMPGENWFSRIVPWVQSWARRPRRPVKGPVAETTNGEAVVNSRVRTIPIRQSIRRHDHTSGFPQLMDWYLLRTFLFYFAVLSAGFIFVFEIFTLFELLDDIARHLTSFIIVANYFRYHIPFLFYQLSPLAALVATLVTIGVMTKNNEIVAINASGMSLYRLALPLVAGSALLSVGLLTLDSSFLPYANQRQDELRNIIKARPPQTYLRPNRNWIFGENNKVYNYEVFDPDAQFFGGLNVYELDPASFALKRRVHAERAVWTPGKNSWSLESGWVRDFDGDQITRFVPFDKFDLAELSEPPSYFNREVRQYYQMDWWQLAEYIRELRQAGFDVGRLTVQWQKKLAFPMIAPVITLLAIPFALLVGTRGAIGGVALGVGIAIVYWATSSLFEALGGVGQLPPIMAAWAPDAIFAFLAAYFFLRMPT